MSLKRLFRKLAGSGAGGRRGRLVRAAQAAKEARDWRGAAGFYAQAVAIRDGFGPRVQLGHMLKEAGDLPQAEAHYFKALEMRPEDADLHLQLGHFFWVKGEPERSLEFYRRAAELAPNDRAIADHVLIGEMRAADAPLRPALDAALKALDHGRWAEAEPHLRRLVAAGRRDHNLLLGHALKEQGRLDEAIKAYGLNLEAARGKGGRRLYEAELAYAQALQLAQRFSEAGLHFAEARMLRLEAEGWAGSVDELLEQVRICVRHTHPALDPDFIR